MGELTNTEKQLALLVIREMEKNQRSIQDLENGAQEVLDVFRKVTALPIRLPSDEEPRKGKTTRQSGFLIRYGSSGGENHFPTSESPEDLLTASVSGRPLHKFLETRNEKKLLVVYAWTDLGSNKISRIRVLVEMATAGAFDTIAGEAPGPFDDQDTANALAVQIANRWFEREGIDLS